MPGQYDRYNMKRQVSLTANIAGADLGTVSPAGHPRPSSAPASRRAAPRSRSAARSRRCARCSSGLALGLGLAVVVIFLLLTANFQSLRLALVAVSTAPAVIAGVVLTLWLTGTTLNIQSFIGAIMAVGVAMANAILLVTFAEAAPPRRRRRAHRPRSTAPPAGSGRSS